MVCNRETTYIIVILFLPFQFQFLHDFYLQALENVKSSSADFKIPFSQTEAAEKVFFASATVGAIISIFLYYKIKRRRLFISINFIINAIEYLLYLTFNEKNFWLAIVLRIFNGLSCAVFHSIAISYLFNYIYDDFIGFWGYFIQTVMFLSLGLVYLFFTFMGYKIIAIILAVQCLVISGVIFLIPEVRAPSKSVTHEHIFQRHNLHDLFVTVMLMVFQQFCGINIVLRKVPMMLEGIGLKMKTTLQYVFMCFVGFLSNFIGSFITVSISRKIMWSISSLGILAGLILFALTLVTENLANWVGTLGAFLFYLFYGLGVGPIAWYFGGELFNDSLRIEAGAITLITNQVFTIVYTYIEQEILKKFDEIGSVVLCAVFDFASIFFGMYFIPAPKYNDNNNELFL